MAFLHISPRQSKSLQAVAKVSEDSFKKIATEICRKSEVSVKASDLLKRIEVISKDADFAKALCSQLMSLSSFGRSEHLDVEGVLAALYEGIKRSELDPTTIAWFDGVREPLKALLESEAIRLPAKALGLSGEYERILSTANVVTDVRPVFDHQRDLVIGAVVSQALIVSYLENSRRFDEGSISIVLDVKDIDGLIEELTRAKRKAEKVKEQFGESLAGNIFAIGEEAYGFD